jgi:hypothetical protein
MICLTVELAISLLPVFVGDVARLLSPVWTKTSSPTADSRGGKAGNRTHNIAGQWIEVGGKERSSIRG